MSGSASVPNGRAGTVGSITFAPDRFFNRWARGELSVPSADDLQGNLESTFHLPPCDTYVYHAIASVALAQVQEAISHGGAHGMHAWYKDADGKQIDPPSSADIEAYTSIFLPTTSTSKSLNALASNAKKDSLRAGIAAHLLSKRDVSPELSIAKVKIEPSSPVIAKRKTSPAAPTIAKRKTSPPALAPTKPQITATSSSNMQPRTILPNPYLEYWAWSCRTLEWAGPNADTVKTKQSHHILPIFYHHFGCICPSFEALSIIQRLADGREVIDAGSGNGYWTYMLRRMKLTVHAVDNGDSLWRTMWIGDTIRKDAAKYLQRKDVDRGRNAVLLLVYPQAGGTFTADTLRAYEGDTVCVAGTQNANRYTGFSDEGIEEWMKREKPEFKKTVQTPLPSFAGKDEAFFVFQRKG